MPGQWLVAVGTLDVQPEEGTRRVLSAHRKKGTVPVEMHNRGTQTRPKTLVLACTRGIDVWAAGAICEAQRDDPCKVR